MKKAREGVQSFCFASLNMQNLWRCPCRRVVDLKLSIVGVERGGYISLNVILSVNFPQIGPLNVI